LRERNEDQKRKTKIIRYDTWQPTQEELLKEALQTEEINMKSLGMHIKIMNSIQREKYLLYYYIYNIY